MRRSAIVLTLILHSWTMTVPAAAAQDCLNYHDCMHLAGVLSMSHPDFINPQRLYADGNLLCFLHEMGRGDTVLVSNPAEPRLVRCKMNPSDSLTRVEFMVERPEHIAVHVHDTSSRLVATLADRHFGPDMHSVNWNGHDCEGRVVAAGTYVVGMHSESSVDTRAFVLARQVVSEVRPNHAFRHHHLTSNLPVDRQHVVRSSSRCRKAERAYLPIVYVRGYARSQNDVENTVATPYMGFNQGSTMYIPPSSYGPPKVWVFESLMLRLMKDHDYVDAYSDGERQPSGPTDKRSIWIFRYYDDVSKVMPESAGQRKEIEDYADELREFIRHVLKATNAKKVYLVAHSMGGLICRCYLQNSKIKDLDGKNRKTDRNTAVDKLFTYATPHGGIEFRRGLRWVEGIRDFLGFNNSDNFGEERMREFLDRPTGDIQSMGGRFPAERVFSLVGTAPHDYGAAAGLSSFSVGPMSDGLVQITNAYVSKSPRAFVYRCHSGHLGIVNSEEGYQNLQGFLFGDLRVALALNNVEVKLPNHLRHKKNVQSTYSIETIVSIRGIPVILHRRTMDEGTAIHRNDDVITARRTHLYTAFLNSDQMVKWRQRSNEHELGFMVHVRIVPRHHVDKKPWRDDHFEGTSVFDDTLQFIVEMTGSDPGGIKCDFFSELDGDRTRLQMVDTSSMKDPVTLYRKSFEWPLITGDFEIEVSKWNDW